MMTRDKGVDGDAGELGGVRVVGILSGERT
jgi:hypothetical protein